MYLKLRMQKIIDKEYFNIYNNTEIFRKRWNKMKKIISFLLCVLIFIFNTPLVQAEDAIYETKQSNYILEEVSLDDIYTDQELYDYLNEFDGFNIINQEYQNLSNQIKSDLVSYVNKSLDEELENKLSLSDIEKLTNKYGLRDSAEEYIQANHQLLVERDALTREVSNVWYITYWTTDAGFSIKVADVGDKLDEFKGNVELYRMNGSKWYTESVGRKEFSKSQVGNGTVFTWAIPVKYVKEKFEYNLIVNEDTSSWKYSNVGKDNQIRFSFAAGQYNSLDAKGGERHHFVSQDALKSGNYSVNTAYCIRMTRDDHMKTGSYGSSTVSRAYREEEKKLLKDKKYRELLQKEVDDFKAKKDPDGKFKNLSVKYYDEILICLAQYEKLFGIN